MARNKRLSQLTIRRTTNRCTHSDKGTSTSTGRELRSLGWHVLDIRLCCQRIQEEGRPVRQAWRSIEDFIRIARL